MKQMLTVARTGDIPDGTSKKYVVQDIEILILNSQGKYYAIQNRCPHMGGDLSQGKIEGLVITCPRHGSQFSLEDGSVVRWLKGTGLLSTIGKAVKHPQNLAAYKVLIDGQNIILEI
jgi:3-phenylpropionate/trans-cinnamate dioxygenase ferredoxin component